MKLVGTFKIDEFFVNAPSQEQAEYVIRLIGLLKENDRLLIIDFGDGSQIINIRDDRPTKIFTKHGKTIQYCGEIQAGNGYKLVQSAIDSVNISAKESAKLSAAVKKTRRNARHVDDSKAIAEFDAAIPDIAKALYSDTMIRIDATTAAYKLEIIDGICEREVVVKPHNWIPILTWFRDNVLNQEESLPVSNRRTFYQLRKAFVTTVLRMASDDVRNANAMRLAKEDKRDDDFWVKYGENKK